MVAGGETTVIVAVSTLGALAQSWVALRWYEPPARDGETPDPVFEGALFLFGFAVVFGVLGVVVSTLGRVAPPLGTLVSLVLVPVGLALAYAAYTDRFEATTSDAARYMGVVFGVVLGVYPLLFLAA